MLPVTGGIRDGVVQLVSFLRGVVSSTLERALACISAPARSSVDACTFCVLDWVVLVCG